MRILLLASDYGLHLNMTGGAGTHLRGTIKGFTAHGHDVLPVLGGDVLFPGVGETGLRSVVRSALKMPLPRKVRLLARDVRYFLRGTQVVRRSWGDITRFRPEVVYERSAFMNDAGVRVARRLGIPLFFESDGCLVESYTAEYGVFSSRLASAVERRKAGAARRIVVMAESAIAYVASKYRQPVEKFVVKGLGVDPSAFAVDDALARQVKDTYRLHDRFVVGFVAGQLQTYHGMRLLLEAMGRLRESRPDVVALVIAGGTLFEKLREANGSCAVNVAFSPIVPKEQIASYMAAFDVGVVPDCVPHMFPIKVLEYGLLGVCPLVPQYPAYEGVLTNPVFPGTNFPPDRADALAAAIVALRDDQAGTRIRGARWREEVLAKHTWEKTVMAVLEAMETKVAPG